MGVGIGPFYITFFSISFVFVTCKCNIGLGSSLFCLSCVLWMGWGCRMVGLGFVYNLLGMVLGIFFLLNIFDLRFTLYAWCMGFKLWLWVCVCVFFSIILFIFFFKSCLFFYICNLCIGLIPIILRVWWGLVVLFCMSSLPPPNPSTGK